MHIKRLELRGFKSFADKTELHLAEGMTAVVGPNGSGKSNLADAIKWVLGEQSAKALRGSRMDELIFSGTKNRRGLGLAEVTLVFDNTSGRFPLAFNEVAVTRRVYKSGESEYFLNQSKCRLRDIQNLFLDTGSGQDAYSFIGQGRIDELLSARPEDRRAIFEEVAGIAKYKARKRETENKLQDAEAALTRIHDLLAELETEKEPLEIEAQRAQEYLRLEAELRNVERDLLLYELNMATRRWERDQKQQAQLQDQSQEKQAALLRAETEEEELRLQLATKQQELEVSNQELLAAVREQEQLASEAKVLARRQEDREAQRRLLQARKHELQQSEQALVELEQAAMEALETIRQQRVAAESHLALYREQLGQLTHYRYEEELQKAEAELHQQNTAYNEAMMNLKLWQERVERLQGELEAEKKRNHELTAHYRQLQEKARTIAWERGAAEDKVQRLMFKADGLKAERERMAQQLAAVEEQQRQVAQELAVIRSRFGLLREVADGLEGYQRGVRGLLQAKRRGEPSLQGIVGVVGDLLQVEPRYRDAIEAALGGSIQFLIAATEKDAQQGIEWLKSTQMGRATFLPLDVVKPRQPRPVEVEAAAQAGAIGFANEVVQFSPAIANAIGYLLGHILLVETLPQAIAIARRTNHRVRIVTLEGDVLMPGGSMSGGSRQRQGSSLLGRAQELAQLAASQKALEQQLAQLKQEVEQSRRQLTELQKAREDEEKGLAQQQERLQQLVAQEAGLVQALGEQERQLAANLERVQTMESRLAEATADQAQAEAQLAQARQAVEKQEQVLNELRGRASGQGQERQALEAKLHQPELSLTGLREQEASRERELETARQRLQEVRTSLHHIRAEEQQLVGQLTVGQEELAALERKQEAQARVVATCQERLHQLKGKIETINQHLQNNRELVKRARTQLEETNQQLYNVELRLSRIEADMESMNRRLERDYGITDRTGLHSTLQSRAQGEEKRSELQEELLQLGPVRVSAVQELERLTERIAFLRTQEKDVLASRESLQQIIQEVDQIMANRFAESFAQVRRAFLRLFQELFGGGEAELRLTNPDDPLESGIEIMAQPPGKNLQNIDLLSGGEKALTAIALLCATLEVKPTPFCLLDEIDASLDDVNTRRFMRVISRLAKETQFILITHSKETMMAVDTLYGVTMPEQGVSQLISVELSNEEN
ncbi:MAG: chromosome segregation protein SMC [Firmicutes bacterium]|nr:chromosome segregation protein SMC [Bacillota bacterium]